MMQKQDLTVLVSTGSWAEQFTEALTVSAGNLDQFKLYFNFSQVMMMMRTPMLSQALATTSCTTLLCHGR